MTNMSGHHSFSKLTADFDSENRGIIQEKVDQLKSEMDDQLDIVARFPSDDISITNSSSTSAVDSTTD